MIDHNLSLVIHGMGVGQANWFEAYSKLLSKQSSLTFQPLFYGDKVEALSLWVLADTYAEEDADLARLEGIAEGYLTASIGLSAEEEQEALQVQGDLGNPHEVVLNLWKYAIRYLIRKQLHTAVYDAVSAQVSECIETTKAAKGSLILIAHSLGTVVGLDLLNDVDLGPYFGRFVTLGSPLGGIASVPVVGKRVLPSERRKVHCRWSDFAAKGDPVSKLRISSKLGFSGSPLQTNSVVPTAGYSKPHSSYFFDKEALNQWIGALAD